ncbi:hypothetical protein GW571_14860 (plasmid) [Clavibacter capsici]|uniref:Uncharacterized protein n=1 Tax=Clavibacter capsici TaxID=1874630 RepID=A0A0M4H373_9MICO|nr:hypothetical protein [Clavibacter capsici]ALD14412.1 hypothetical protein AES38_15160 [Clavibacter capsici]QIS40553.1 hypothetical protein GW572_15365 [Clavibacter capsici]QIS43516.1 hypothetical protein GW571_14860 [Clavibacter capsici]QIS46438.1 hypothetical protein GW570_14695 [Clavibacter capsici]
MTLPHARPLITTAASILLSAAIALGGGAAADAADLPNPTHAAPRDNAIMLSVTNPKVHAIMVYPLDGSVPDLCIPIHYGWNSIPLNGQTAAIAIGSSCNRQEKLKTFPTRIVHSREWWDANPRDYLRQMG